MSETPTIAASSVVIRFAGDSGDGMQLTGDRFTAESALWGNDISTLPNFPAEIRAPAGTVPGVSSFQVHIADHPITTPGDRCDVLIAMNPAALAANWKDVEPQGTIIVDEGAFTKRNITKAGWDTNPLEGDLLSNYRVIPIDLTGMTLTALDEFDLGRKDKERSKNMFALGFVCWMYNRPIEQTLAFIESKFSKLPEVANANIAAFNAGYAFGETVEAIGHRVEVAPAALPTGLYRQISGNMAMADGLCVGGHLAGLPLVFGAYPITPASDILHYLAARKNIGVTTIQAEDEIAAAGVALGASFAGSLGVTASSGPGIALKSETLSLGVMTELPMVVIDVQRAGPSTGMPTKTEQSDLLHAMFGRHGEAPMPVLAAQSPSDCFHIAVEACRIAIEYRTPVMVLSDGYLANGAEPFAIPDVASMPRINTNMLTEPNGEDADGNPILVPYQRDERFVRPWVVPGTPGLAHRLGGLEKDETGNISYVPENHECMVTARAQKVASIPVPELQVDDPSGQAKVLVLGWGSTWGPIAEAIRRVRLAGGQVAQAHLRYLNPMPPNLEQVLRGYDRVVIPEMNMGQLAMLIRSQTLVEVESYTQVRGLPIAVGELGARLAELVGIDPVGLSSAKPGDPVLNGKVTA
ncbi:2-oxoacid:acceptor oxidoreductase subunit alpha [Stomatohabitans albus]|uniref:2-oxoacid:acceptor oxidoreductase subunit alpha n=1 Tax=Stomatohabitans albus TaxID=3110766 RepID=UPI00300CF499